MKRILSVFINRDNAIRIMVTALLAASSQPLIAWSMAGLSGAFLENELGYAAVFSNIMILLLALFIAWFADNIKANLLLDSEFELRRQVFDSIYAMPIDEFEKKDSGAVPATYITTGLANRSFPLLKSTVILQWYRSRFIFLTIRSGVTLI